MGLIRIGRFAATLCTACLAVVLTSHLGVAQSAATDSVAVAAVIGEFHAALLRGDSLTALALLADDAKILEGGGIETRAEYRSGHLAGDMGFAQQVSREIGETAVVVRRNVAWATSVSVTTGEYRGRTIDSRGAELAVLTRVDGKWKISAVHWSSRARRGR